MLELLKNKYIIILAIMIVGVCYLTALDNKKADEISTKIVDSKQTVLYK